jgi:hypothetical protein
MPIFSDLGFGRQDKTSTQTGPAKTAADQTQPADQPQQSAQLDEVQARLESMAAKLSSARIFDVLEAVRDQFGDLQEQNQQIRNDTMALQRSVFELNGPRRR